MILTKTNLNVPVKYDGNFENLKLECYKPGIWEGRYITRTRDKNNI